MAIVMQTGNIIFANPEGAVTNTEIATAAFTFNEGTIIAYDKTKDSNFPNIVIPATINGEDVTTIGSKVFEIQGLKSVTIPEGITNIGAYAFNGNNLVELNLPNSITTIGAYAFNGNHLTDLTLNEGLVNIGVSAFAYNDLTQVNFSSTIRTIGNAAFALNDLSKVTLNEGLVSIGDMAFASNHILGINLPQSVTTLGVSVLSENSVWITSNEVANYDYNTKTLIIDWQKFLLDHGVISNKFNLKSSEVYTQDVVSPVNITLDTPIITIQLTNYNSIPFNQERTLFSEFDLSSTNGQVTLNQNSPIRFKNNIIFIDLGDLKSEMTINQGENINFNEQVHAFDMHDGIIPFSITANGKPITSTSTLTAGTYNLVFTSTDATADSVDDTNPVTTSKSIELTVVADKELKKLFIIGYPNDTVRPYNNITKAETVVAISRLLNINEPQTNYVNFSDVKTTDYYYKALNKLMSIGVIDLTGESVFGGEGPIKREEFIDLLVKVENLISDGTTIEDFINENLEAGEFINRSEAILIINKLTNRIPDIEVINQLPVEYTDLSKADWGFYEIMDASTNHYVIEEDGEQKWIGN